MFDPITTQRLGMVIHQERLLEAERIHRAERLGVPVQPGIVAKLSAALSGWWRQTRVSSPAADIRRTTASYPVVK